VIAFFDASALICLIEGQEPFAGSVRAAIRSLIGRHPDALPAASCLQLATEHLLRTADAAFERVTDLNVRVLS